MSGAHNWRDVPIPARMAHLDKDGRGFPIPYIVAYTAQGDPVFTVNDERLGFECIRNCLCGICGEQLEVGDMWWVGGPLSAFHPNGCYYDGPMHEECSTYALQVCPYIAAPRYSRRIDDRAAKIKDAGFTSGIDPTVMPDRPGCFVQARSVSFSVSWPYDMHRKMFPISRPGEEGTGPVFERFIDYRVWVKGVHIEDEEEAHTILRSVIQASLQQKVQKPKIIMPDREIIT